MRDVSRRNSSAGHVQMDLAVLPALPRFTIWVGHIPYDSCNEDALRRFIGAERITNITCARKESPAGDTPANKSWAYVTLVDANAMVGQHPVAHATSVLLTGPPHSTAALRCPRAPLELTELTECGHLKRSAIGGPRCS